ncbi:MAG: hypothetical protein R3F65_03925 [bacterium]
MRAEGLDARGAGFEREHAAAEEAGADLDDLGLDAVAGRGVAEEDDAAVGRRGDDAAAERGPVDAEVEPVAGVDAVIG